MTSKTVHFQANDQEFSIEGNSSDRYLNAAQAEFAGFALLAALARMNVPSGGTILDVGANIGLSVIALSLAAPSARIIAFEPSPVNLKYLRRNIDANGIKNVTIVEKAVSDNRGELLFHEASSGSGSHVFSSSHIGSGAGTISVEKTTIDDSIVDLSSPVSLIKIDVEGHEPNVLAGASRTIVRDSPLIFMEFNSWCLTAMGGHNPATFARAIWNHFSVLEYCNGNLSDAKIDAFSFVHRNLIERGCVDDMVLRYRAGSAFPSLQELSWPEEAVVLLKATPAGNERPQNSANAISYLRKLIKRRAP